MRCIKTIVGAGALLCAASLPTYGNNITLFEWAFNINTVVTENLVPGAVDASMFNWKTGLGKVSISLGEGDHYVGFYLDHEIDQIDNTYYNEDGSPVNSPGVKQTWEIDEPGYGGSFGDIYNNFLAGQLDNTKSPAQAVDDVSMALAWALSIGTGQSGTLSFMLSETKPDSGFYLHQWDPDSAGHVYFSSTYIPTTTPPDGLPDGGSTLGLLLCAFAGLAGWRTVRKS